MGAYKQFLSNDVIISPLTLNKSFVYEGSSSFKDSQVQIEVYLGKNITNSFFNPNTEPTSGLTDKKYQRLIYNSAKELYYYNHLTSSYGDLISTASLIPGVDEEGDVWVGNIRTPNFVDYKQTTLSYPRYFPTGSNEVIGLISIPSKLYGDYIQPKSFRLYGITETYDTDLGLTNSFSTELRDDGEGNIVSNTSASYIMGNINYSHGLVTLTREITWATDTGSVALFYFGFDSTTNYPSVGDSIDFTVNGTLQSTLTFVDANPGSSQCIAYSSYTGSIQSWTLTQFIPAIQNIPYLNTNFPIIDGRNLNIFSAEAYVYMSSINSIYSGSTGPTANGFAFSGYITNFPGSNELLASSSLELYLINNISVLSCSFSSSYTIYETQYKCTIKENEYNCSMNPSLIKSGTLDTVYDYVTGSMFTPYITTVGLYDDNQNLLAVAKLAQPVQTNPMVDLNILINIDR